MKITNLIHVLESDLHDLHSRKWLRCGTTASEWSVLNMPRDEKPPSFGNSISDILEENITVNMMNTTMESLFTDDEIALVKYGVRAALECVTVGSPHLRNDLFR
jgi:hypothetical protein